MNIRGTEFRWTRVRTDDDDEKQFSTTKLASNNLIKNQLPS